MHFWDFIKQEALAIKSDGCTKVADFRRECCWLHDLAYYWGKDPKLAHRLYVDGFLDCWELAPRISRADADQLIRQCYRDKSPVNGLSPFVWTRYLGTRLGGWWAWRKHRKERP